METIKKHCPNVQIQTRIGSYATFLNAYIENQDGQLHTRVYHEPNIQRYTLPYVMNGDHPKLQHSDWLRSTLIRAICYCSSVNDFYRERILIELTYLVNGYSLYFLELHLIHFFHYFQADDMRYSMDQIEYDKFRRQIFEFVKLRRQRSNKNEKLDNDKKLFRFNYLYEFGDRCEFNKEFHQIWSKYFNKHPILSENEAKVHLTTKQIYSLNALLSRQKTSFFEQQKM